MELGTIIGIGLTLLSNGFIVAMFCVVKFNDLHHLSKGLEEIKESVKCIEKKLYSNAEEIGEIKGKCKANHG